MDKPKKTIGDPLVPGSCHANPKYITWANLEITKQQAEIDEASSIFRELMNKFYFTVGTPVRTIQAIENFIEKNRRK